MASLELLEDGRVVAHTPGEADLVALGTERTGARGRRGTRAASAAAGGRGGGGGLGRGLGAR